MFVAGIFHLYYMIINRLFSHMIGKYNLFWMHVIYENHKPKKLMF